MPKNTIHALGCKYGSDVKEGASKKLDNDALYIMTIHNIVEGKDAEFQAIILPQIAEASECMKPKSAEVYVCYPKPLVKFAENMDNFEKGIKDAFFEPKKCN